MLDIPTETDSTNIDIPKLVVNKNKLVSDKGRVKMTDRQYFGDLTCKNDAKVSFWSWNCNEPVRQGSRLPSFKHTGPHKRLMSMKYRSMIRRPRKMESTEILKKLNGSLGMKIEELNMDKIPVDQDSSLIKGSGEASSHHE